MDGNSVGLVEIEVTIGMFGGSCITKVIKSNPNFDTDLNDMGAYIEDLIDGKPPEKQGVYIFKGETFFMDSIDDPEYYTEWEEPKLKETTNDN